MEMTKEENFKNKLVEELTRRREIYWNDTNNPHAFEIAMEINSILTYIKQIQAEFDDSIILKVINAVREQIATERGYETGDEEHAYHQCGEHIISKLKDLFSKISY